MLTNRPGVLTGYRKVFKVCKSVAGPLRRSESSKQSHIAIATPSGSRPFNPAPSRPIDDVESCVSHHDK